VATCWAERYAGLPADTTLKGNCLGFVRLIMREQFRKEFPGFLGILRAARRGEQPPMVQRRTMKEGTVVVCGNQENPVRHVGVYCQAAERVVHAVTDIPDGIVRAEPLWRLRHEWPVVTFWEVVRT